MISGGYVYIMTNKNNSVLYVGVTSNLKTRICQHREFKYPNSFTSRYNITKLVYYQGFIYIEEAIKTEKKIKAGSRNKKLKLINEMNPSWKDLYKSIPDGE
jgi:putative endonuclease